MGFLVTINTNGTLINTKWANFFSKHRCKHFNITLYGKDDETYKNLCHNSNGFSSVMRAATLLKERNIPFTFTSSLISENAHQLEELYQIAQKLEVPYKPATYMFPAIRRNISANKQNRLSPQDAAYYMLKYYELGKSSKEMNDFVHSQLTRLFLPPRLVIAKDKKGYPCRGGKSGFWITWQGLLTSCAMLEHPQMNLLIHPFEKCWKYIVDQTKEVLYCDKCLNCSKQNICHVCPAAIYTETLDFQKNPEYICEYTDELINLLLQFLSPEEQLPYKCALQNGGFKQIF